MNGSFDRTSETSGGYAVYSKRGDASMCIEHFGGQWQLKPVSLKGKDGCWAYVAGDKDGCYAYVAGDCALQDCTSRVWRVVDGETHVDQASVKLATGREAERQVCGSCTRAHTNTTPLHLILARAFCRVTRIAFCTGC